MLASDVAAVPIAGGTDLLVHWPVRGEARERTYVICPLDPLKAVALDGGRGGARGLTTYWDVIQTSARGGVSAARGCRPPGGGDSDQARGTWREHRQRLACRDGVPVP